MIRGRCPTSSSCSTAHSCEGGRAGNRFVELLALPLESHGFPSAPTPPANVEAGARILASKSDESLTFDSAQRGQRLLVQVVPAKMPWNCSAAKP